MQLYAEQREAAATALHYQRLIAKTVTTKRAQHPTGASSHNYSPIPVQPVRHRAGSRLGAPSSMGMRGLRGRQRRLHGGRPWPTHNTQHTSASLSASCHWCKGLCQTIVRGSAQTQWEIGTSKSQAYRPARAGARPQARQNNRSIGMLITYKRTRQGPNGQWQKKTKMPSLRRTSAIAPAMSNGLASCAVQIRSTPCCLGRQVR